MQESPSVPVPASRYSETASLTPKMLWFLGQISFLWPRVLGEALQVRFWERGTSSLWLLHHFYLSVSNVTLPFHKGETGAGEQASGLWSC